MVVVAVLLLAVLAASAVTAQSSSCTDLQAGTCTSFSTEAGCLGAKSTALGTQCQWCISKAVPSLCANSDQIKHLAPSVFICGNCTHPPSTH